MRLTFNRVVRTSADMDKIPPTVHSLQTELIVAAFEDASNKFGSCSSMEADVVGCYEYACERREKQPKNKTLLIELVTEDFYNARLMLKEMKFRLKLINKKCDFITKLLRQMEII